MNAEYSQPICVIPVLIGPLQVLLAVLPAMLMSFFAALIALLKPSSIKAGLKILWRNKFAAATAVIVIVGVCRAVRYARERFGRRAVKIEAAQTDWPMFRGGPTRRGWAADGQPDPATGGRLWNFASEVKTFYSSPAVLGNRVFVASVDYGPLRDRGALYCLDADSGAVIAKYAPARYRATFSSPAVSGKYLVCGEGLHFTTDARIICAAVESASFKPLWEVRTKSHVESSACIYNGRVYIGAGDDGFYCIALEPGPDGKAQVVWHLDGKEYPDCETSPAACDGKIYFGLGMGGKAVVCVDAETGRQVWRVPTPYPVFSHPCVVEGKVFVGMGNGNIVETAEEVREKELKKLRDKGASREELEKAHAEMGPAGEVWCLDAKSGNVLWRHKTGQVVLSAIAEADGRLYFADRGGTVSSLTLDGTLMGKFETRQPIVNSPAVAGQHVYVVTMMGRLYCLERQTMKPVWEAAAGLGKMFVSSPCIARGHVYVGTEADGLVCVGEPCREGRQHIWPGRLGGPGRSGWLDGSPPPPRARFGWRYPREPEGGEAGAPLLEIKGPPAHAPGSLLVPVAGERNGLLKLALDERQEKLAGEAWLHPVSNGLSDSVAVLGSEIFFVAGARGAAPRRLVCADSCNGTLKWARDVAPQAAGTMTLAGSKLIVLDGESAMSCLAATNSGALLWSVELDGTPVGCPAVVESMVLVAFASEPAVALFSEVNGRRLWRSRLREAPVTGPVSMGDMVAVGTAVGELVGLSLVDGSEKWAVRCGELAADPVCDEEHVACVTKEPEIVVVDWSGREVLRLKDVAIPVTPMLCRDTLLYFGEDTLRSVSIATGKREDVLTRMSWLGTVTTPAVMVNSQLYFCTEKKGLVCVRPAK